MMNLQSSTHFSTSLALAALAIGLCQAPPAFPANPAPCAANPHSRQLDFWLGDWTISAPGSANAVSTVSLALDQCMVIESWDAGRGHKGENIFAYSSDEKIWHGMFADNEGRVHVFLNGKVSSGFAEFSGPSRGPDGQPVLNRVRIVRLGPGKAEQVWQKSTDDGTTWSTEFRGEYSRRNPRRPTKRSKEKYIMPRPYVIRRISIFSPGLAPANERGLVPFMEKSCTFWGTVSRPTGYRSMGKRDSERPCDGTGPTLRSPASPAPRGFPSGPFTTRVQIK